MGTLLSDPEKQFLLRLAREAIDCRVKGKKLPGLDQGLVKGTLLEPGASFVTLTIGENLRGCIGTLEAYQPLAEDVREHAIAAAFQDPRFPAVTESELKDIKIEVS